MIQSPQFTQDVPTGFQVTSRPVSSTVASTPITSLSSPTSVADSVEQSETCRDTSHPVSLERLDSPATLNKAMVVTHMPGNPVGLLRPILGRMMEVEARGRLQEWTERDRYTVEMSLDISQEEGDALMDEILGARSVDAEWSRDW